jgi:hypothetical protein
LKRRIELLEAKALQPESPVRRVYLRAASLPDRIYIAYSDEVGRGFRAKAAACTD